jgi:hypothetical protein
MKFEEYRREMEALFIEYVKSWQESGGTLPKGLRLPAIYRPYYKKFEFNLTVGPVDLTGTPDSIITEIDAEIDRFRTQVFETVRETRTAYLQSMAANFPRKTAITDKPRTANRKSRNFEQVIENARKALEAWRQKQDTRLSIASDVLGFKNTESEKSSKSAEREARRYIEFADRLMRAVVAGNFFEALEKPLPRNK